MALDKYSQPHAKSGRPGAGSVFFFLIFWYIGISQVILAILFFSNGGGRVDSGMVATDAIAMLGASAGTTASADMIGVVAGAYL